MPVEQHPFPEVVDADRGGADPPFDSPDYVGTRLRAPKEPLVIIPSTLTELTGPAYGESAIGPLDDDLTRQHAGQPLGERIVVSGRVLGAGRQAAARAARRDLAGERRGPLPARRRHARRAARPELLRRRAAASPTTTAGTGSSTVKPGAYPWGNHHNAWRPNHIHFSLFGRAFTERLVTQMYFPGDPLFEFDPIFNSIRGREGARAAGLPPRPRADGARLGARLPLGHRARRARGDAVGGAAR